MYKLQREGATLCIVKSIMMVEELRYFVFYHQEKQVKLAAKDNPLEFRIKLIFALEMFESFDDTVGPNYTSIFVIRPRVHA